MKIRNEKQYCTIGLRLEHTLQKHESNKTKMDHRRRRGKRKREEDEAELNQHDCSISALRAVNPFGVRGLAPLRCARSTPKEAPGSFWAALSNSSELSGNSQATKQKWTIDEEEAKERGRRARQN